MVKKLLLFGLCAFLSGNLCAQKMPHRDSIDIYLDRSQSFKALDYSNRQLSKLQKANNISKLIPLYWKQSRIYVKLGDSKKAMEILYEALSLSQKIEDPSAEAATLKEIAGVFAFRMDYVSAKKKIYESLAIAKKLPNDSIENSLMQLTFKTHMASNSDSTYYYLKKTEAYLKSKKNHGQSSMAYTNAFVYYFTKGDTLKAQKYMDSAVAEARLFHSPQVLADALSNRAAIFYYKKDFVNAKKYYDEMFRINPGDSVSYQASDLYYTYSGILAGLGDYKSAYKYAEKSIEFQDDVYGADINSAIWDVEKRYVQRTESEKRSRERLVYLIVIAVFCISLILLYFFYQNNKLKQKNRLSEIESETSQKLLSATLDARETERKQIASVLHDSISAMLSSAGLQLTAFSAGHGNNDEIAKTRQILKEAHDKVRDLSHELVPTLLVKFGLAYALEDLCEKFSSPELQITYQDDGSVKRYGEEFETKIYFIASELLNNVQKHSGGDQANVRLAADTDLRLTIKDNGKGFDTARPDGFGLTQIKARISAMKGKISVASKPGQGSEIKISVPIA